MSKVFLDIETLPFRTGECPDLSKVGVAEYAKHVYVPVACYALDDQPVRTIRFTRDEWVGCAEKRGELQNAINGHDEVWAHNSAFEHAVISRQLDFPPHRIRDTMVLAKALNLPASLGNLAEFLNVASKDKGGNEHMLSMHSRTADDLLGFREDEFVRLAEYCAQDVVVLRDIWKRLHPKFIDLMGKYEPQLWKEYEADLSMNAAGFCVDRQFIETGTKLMEERLEIISRAMMDTDASLGRYKPTNILAVLKWAAKKLDYKPDIDKSRECVQKLMGLAFPMGEGGVFKVLQGTLEATAATPVSAKFKIAHQLGQDDDRLRGCFLFMDAANGRWTSRRYQAQNISRNNFKGEPKTITDLGDCQRRLIMADEGKRLLVSDYKQVELRCLLAFAGEDKMLAELHSGKDFYKVIASGIYGVPYDEVSKEQRFYGKTAVLGAGYGAAPQKLLREIHKTQPHATIDIAQRAYDGYHNTLPLIKKSYDAMERALNAAMEGKTIWANNCTRFSRFGNSTLVMTLPSGRATIYQGMKRTESGWTYQTYRYGKWHTNSIWGAKLVQGAVSGIARDALADALVRCEAQPRVRVVATVHDSILAEVDEGDTEAREDLIRCMVDAQCGLDVPLSVDCSEPVRRWSDAVE